MLREHFGVDFKYDFCHTKDEVIATLRAKVPVIVVVRWSDSYHRSVRILRDGKANDDQETSSYWAKYKDLGATPEMCEKVKNGIIPYPNDEMIEKSEYAPVTHAVLCVGYDSGDDAFIVRDYNPGTPDYNGFFKLESKLFFDPKLSSEKRISVVEAVISINVKRVKR